MDTLKSLKFLFVFVLSISNLNANNEYSISWELENPFKFFQNVDDYNTIKDKYNIALKSGLNKNDDYNIGLAFEKELQKNSVKKISLEDKKKYWVAEKKGWASMFKEYNDKTCWNFNSRLYNNPKCKDYIYPKRHKVVVKLNNVPEKAKCDWFYDNKPLQKIACNNVSNNELYCLDKLSKSNNCTEKITLGLKYFSNDKNDKLKNRTHKLKVKIRETNISKNIEIKVEDILVVGLGDSFGSGEGNPDEPATVTGKNANKDTLFVGKNSWQNITKEGLYLPRKDKKNMYAKWIDRRCHRSLYSYQFQTALQLSMRNPQKAVTFLSFACTGATTDHIIDKKKSASEESKFKKDRYLNISKKNQKVDRNKKVYPQLELLNFTLDNGKKEKRKVDLLLLSTGGNDIGFAKYVMNVMLTDKLLQLSAKKIKPFDTGKDLEKILTKNYSRLNFEINSRNLLIDNDSNRILLTAYPNILKDEKGELCKESKNSVFDMPFGRSKKNERERKIYESNLFLIEPLYETQKKLSKLFKWSFIDEHSKSYLKHGFCAKSDGELNTIPFAKYVKPTWDINFNKNLHLDWCSEDIMNKEEIRCDKDTFSKYKPYSTKQRWVNIPLDSTLKINKTQCNIFWCTDLFFSDETSGVMHPTSEGLAVTAAANVDYICDNLIDCEE